MTKKKLRRSILIVCEGTKTEHDYFSYIASHVTYPKGLWDIVEVCDNKTIPSDIPISADTELGKRKKRHFTNPNKSKITEQNVLKELCKHIYGHEDGIEEYDNIKAVPLRYIAQAQLIEEEQQMHDELWAVYDKDGHSHHKEAYKRAEKVVNGKKVQIGFTSRSFEHWLLLHFEKNTTNFSSSECKDEKKRPIECNSIQGCKGNTCLIGYLKANTPLKKFQKSNGKEDLKNMMELLLQPKYLNNAFENANWLRTEIQNNDALKDKKCYELNPYTDIDILVRKLVE